LQKEEQKPKASFLSQDLVWLSLVVYCKQNTYLVFLANKLNHAESRPIADLIDSDKMFSVD